MGWADDMHWDGDPEGQMFDYDGSASAYADKILKICRYCGIGSLHWVRVEGKWKLYNRQDNPHFCVMVVKNRNLRKELKLK